MNEFRCVLVGGPYDGGEFDYRSFRPLPECWWVRPHPECNGRACRHPKFGGTRYLLSAVEGLEATYQHESLKAPVVKPRQKAVA